MLNLIDDINLDENLKNKVIDLAQKDKVKILSLAEKCRKGNFACLANKNDLLRLAVIIKTAEYTKQRYLKLGIPENILADTLDDIRIWCENNGNKGLKNYNWIKNHMNCELFKMGRLQFQFFRCNMKTLNYADYPFNYGDNLIYVHIPQGEKLDYEACKNSLKLAVEFFDKYFPDYKFRYFFCESWLLYDKNKLFMSENSNIIKFSSLFNVITSFSNDTQAIERIFGKRRLIKKKYQENTSLQKSAKAFMQQGGKLGIGIGIIDKSKLV